MTDSLDDLFAEARRTITSERRQAEAKARLPKHIKAPDEAAKADPSFSDPACWTRTRGVALIHAESRTLLGNFSEFVHKTGARKLVREAVPLLVTATEEVSGTWWVARPEVIEEETPWYETRVLLVPIQMSRLAVQSPAVEVTVHLSFGGVARVELVEESMFAQVGGTTEQLLFLPAGTNILPEMDLDCKINLRIELSKGEAL